MNLYTMLKKIWLLNHSTVVDIPGMLMVFGKYGKLLMLKKLNNKFTLSWVFANFIRKSYTILKLMSDVKDSQIPTSNKVCVFKKIKIFLFFDRERLR
jgi:hypothetical protein